MLSSHAWLLWELPKLKVQVLNLHIDRESIILLAVLYSHQIAKKALGYFALPRCAECCSLATSKDTSFLLGIEKYIYRQIG